MSPEPDPLDALRGAWNELGAPPAWRELEHEDDATRRSVAWVAEAWRGLAAPPLPSAARRPRRARVRSLGRVVLATAAAALVLFSFLRRSTSPPAGPPPSSPLAALAPVEVTRNHAGQVELRSGPVRLVVLQRAAPDRTAPRTRPRQR